MRDSVTPLAAGRPGENHLLPPPPCGATPSTATRKRAWLAGAALVAAISLAYHNSVSVPFVFDDKPAIEENTTIRQLWPLHQVLAPPPGEGITVEGRPVLNLSLALNHAFGGTAVAGYHLVNLLLHASAALVLFGLIRRLSLHPPLDRRFAAAATPLAFFGALLWGLHPLQTESVTYVIQRAEGLAGFFYLATLYAFVRAAAGGSRRWLIVSVGMGLAGMGSKEIVVSVPLLVLVCDRTWFGGSFRRAWQLRRGYYLGLLATGCVLAWLATSSGTRGGTAGFGINVTPWQYSLTQYEAIARYLWLSLWPHPLIFDYGVAWVDEPATVIPYALLVLGLFGATLVALRRRSVPGFLGLWFFAILSPTSSIVPGNRQTLAEHRMYLPLAAVIMLVVGGVYLAARGGTARRWLFAGGVAVALVFGILTVRRNEDYRSELVLYRDTVGKRPRNGFARYNLGKVYAEDGRHAAALPEYEEALRLLGNAPGIHYNLANSLAALGRREEAVSRYQAALGAEPRYGRAHFNLGNVLVELGRQEEARAHFAAAVALEPASVEARVNLGGVLLELGRLAEAREHLEHVLRRDPHHALALFNLGNVCILEQRWADAVRLLEIVVALRPDLAVARERLEFARNRAR